MGEAVDRTPLSTHRHTAGGASPCGARRHRRRRACRPQTSLHEEYAKIIEASVDKVLSSTGRPAWELFGMLQSALGTDPRARPLVSVTPLSLQPCAIQTATRCAQAATLSVQAATLRTTGDAQLDGLHGILRAAARARDGGWWGGVTRQAPRWQVVPAERKSTRSSSNCHYSH